MTTWRHRAAGRRARVVGTIATLVIASFAGALVVSPAVNGSSAATASPSYTLSFNNEQIAGPATPSDAPAWLAAMKQWRATERDQIGYDDANYARPSLAWTQHDPIQPQMMVQDRYFYDPAHHRYTVGKYLADVGHRYGGIDSVLVWPTYPNIGIDDRNTADMIRDMPGGIPAIKRMIADFHQHGVKVLFPIHPWDVGTRDPGQPWSAVLPKLMARIGADGLNGDTMSSVGADYFDNSVADGDPLALEPELGLSGAAISDLGNDVMSWGYWDYTTAAPMVSRNKWLEPRHEVHVNDRWSKNKIPMLQVAFFNGVGLESWENIWGIWNQMTDRDDAATRMVATIEREFAPLLISPRWTPYAQTIQSDAVYASKWPSSTTSATLWTMVNRTSSNSSGPQLQIPYQPGTEYFDLWHGTQLTPSVDGTTATLSFPIEANGFGAVLAAKSTDLPHGFTSFLSTMHRYAARPLSSYSAANTVLDQAMTQIAPTHRYRSAPAGMVRIPGANYDFTVRGTEIEGGNDPGVDVQYPWETQPGRYHSHLINIRPFYLDRTPVTNAEYQRFLRATNYHPTDDHNFLKDWNRGHYPAGWADKPVTWVSLQDARAYCVANGERLPNEWEWQYAAQGTDGRNYPWGNAYDASRVPTPDTGRALTAPADVDAHPTGASPFGVLDMVGNVWQWTNEFADQHTRAAVLRGGSYYHAQGSAWYFPSDQNAYRLDHHDKYLLTAPAEDRAGTLGFRCAADATGRGPRRIGTGTIVDDAAPGWTYKGWSRYSDIDAYQGTAHGGSGSTGQYAEYTFTGTGVDVYGWRGPNGGTIQISIDGKPNTQPASEHAPVTAYHQLLARVAGLANGRHTLRIATAPSTTASQWTMIDMIKLYTPADHQPNPTVTAQATRRLVAPGSAVKIIVTVRNDTQRPASGTVQLQLPSGLSSTPARTSFTKLPSGATTTVTFTLAVASDAVGGSRTVRAMATLNRRVTTAAVPLNVLGAAQTVTATGGTTNRIDLTWIPADPNGEAIYQVYGSTTPDFTPGPATLITTTTATTFSHTGLGLDQTWYYRVRPVDPAGNPGALTAQASATTGSTLLIEAESLLPPTSASAPAVRQTDCCGVHWSDGAQIWFQAAKVGDQMTLTITLPSSGKWKLAIVYTKAPDFGMHTLAIDGTQVGAVYDNYDPNGVSIDQHDYGPITLNAGNHQLTFTVTGKQPSSPRYGFGIDTIELTRR